MPAKKKKTKQQSKIRDLKPTKDAKGGMEYKESPIGTYRPRPDIHGNVKI